MGIALQLCLCAENVIRLQFTTAVLYFICLILGVASM